MFIYLVQTQVSTLSPSPTPEDQTMNTLSYNEVIYDNSMLYVCLK